MIRVFVLLCATLSLHPGEVDTFSEQLEETIKERMEYEIDERRHQDMLKRFDKLIEGETNEGPIFSY